MDRPDWPLKRFDPGNERRVGRAQSPATGPARRGQHEPSETVLFEDAAVTVTTAHTVIRQNTSYAVSNITSVEEFVERAPSALATGGLALMIAGLFCVRLNVGDSAAVGWVGAGCGAFIVVVFLLLRPKYWIRIGTAGAETNAIWSHDRTWTLAVLDAIKEAMGRSQGQGPSVSDPTSSEIS
jgi:hypothetical protein